MIISEEMALKIFRLTTRVMMNCRVYTLKYERAKEIRDYIKKQLKGVE